MRSKSTNFLQVVILITGILYLIVGVVFFISPIAFGQFLSMHISEDWLMEIPKDTFISTLYYFAKAFSALLFTMGLAMILPLFDPLKYRGLIYYSGIIFPLIASIILLKNGIPMGHSIITIFGASLLTVFILTSVGLIITRKDAG